jgi:hypothetical protein
MALSAAMLFSEAKGGIPVWRTIIDDNAGTPTVRRTRQSRDLIDSPATTAFGQQSRSLINVPSGEAHRPQLSRRRLLHAVVVEHQLNWHESANFARIGLIG